MKTLIWMAGILSLLALYACSPAECPDGSTPDPAGNCSIGDDDDVTE